MGATKKDSEASDWREVSLENTATWDRKDPIEGELMAVKPNTGPHESMLYMLKTKDGEVSVWGSTVLDNKLEHVPIGVRVKIEPQGLTKSPKSGREYQDFRVFFKDLPFKEVDSDVTDEDIAKSGEAISDDEMPESFLQD